MVQALPKSDDGVASAVPCGRGAMAQAARVIAPAIDGVSPTQQLLSVPARWSVRNDADRSYLEYTPRFQSPRRRGVNPAHPDLDGFDDMSKGTLVVFPGGFVLEPADRCKPCANINRSSVLSAMFYRDAFEVSLLTGERITICTEPVEVVDSIFQAYFWNAAK